VNPYWFVHSPSATRLRLTADTSLLGDWARTSGTTTTLRASPDERAIAVAELPRHTALRVVGAAGSWFRVRLPDGAIGYIAARGAEAADDPVSSASLDASASVFAAPAGIVMAEVRRGDVVPVLGRFGDYLLVRGPDGRDGWLMQQ
jgi:SH3-like domain-containing protein